MNPLIQLKRTIQPFLVALACFALLPTAQAVMPPPDGLSQRKHREGEDALNLARSGATIGFKRS